MTPNSTKSTTGTAGTAGTAGTDRGQHRSLLERSDLNSKAIAMIARPHAIVAGVASFVVSAVVIGFLISWPVGVIVGLLVGGVAALATLKKVPEGAKAKVDAVVDSRPATEDDYPRYYNLIDGLTLNVGAQRPELRVVDSSGLNLAVYGPADAGVVVATTGLLEQLERIELEGVFAAALVRLRANDAELAMQLAANRSFGLLGLGVDAAELPGKTRAAESLVRVLTEAFGTKREFLGDLGAVDITRYPPGLGAAFDKMIELGTHVASATLGTAHLWLVDPLTPIAGEHNAYEVVRLLRTPTPIDQRSMHMAEL